ncbi:MAG TPA: gamma-glutamyltransferase family protein [Ideonella sp.]|jgi:gamma-glutamyltranspeptidase/glutathione hydrolase|nr:gamma-glutamyltransferase family protein [Ideonella sp.]
MRGAAGAWRKRFGPGLLLAALLAACGQAGPPAPPPSAEDLPRQPEAATGLRAAAAQAPQRYQHQAVASAHPLASAAGLRMLHEGGTAIDAAIAVQLVLALVEPQSSGLGGGAFLLHWDGHALQAWDGRETAPAAADENLFLDARWQPMDFDDAVSSGLSVGVPGALRMLEAAHREHGRLPWARLFEPAITLAEQGFPVGARLAGLLRGADAQWLKDDPQARPYFFHAAVAGTAPEPVAQGERLRNPAFAAVLRKLAAQGSGALHEGTVAADIVRRVRGHARHPGLLSESDLAAYQPKRHEALCTPWRRYRVCGFPPPSSGHLATMQILGLLDHLPAPPAPLEAGLPSPGFLHRYAEAARLAYADRARYVADPDFAAPPAGRWTSLLDEAYLARRARLVSDQRSLGRAEAGDPAEMHASQLPAPQAEQPEHGTSHISIVDGLGHAVSMTTTVEAAFGSRIMSDGGTGLAGGFLLNNELTDFAFAPRDAQGRAVANRVEPGKRPRSSMGPTMVFEAQAPQRLLMVMGSPGGSAIIHYNTKVLLATLGWGLSPQEAVDLPNFANDNGATRLEAGRFPLSTREALAARGQRVVEQDLTSGAQVLLRAEGGGWWGGADPRREGVVVGE